MAQADAPAENPAEESAPAVACAFGPEFVRRHQDDVWWYLRFLGCQEAEAERSEDGGDGPDSGRARHTPA